MYVDIFQSTVMQCNAEYVATHTRFRFSDSEVRTVARWLMVMYEMFRMTLKDDESKKLSDVNRNGLTDFWSG